MEMLMLNSYVLYYQRLNPIDSFDLCEEILTKCEQSHSSQFGFLEKPLLLVICLYFFSVIERTSEIGSTLAGSILEDGKI